MDKNAVAFRGEADAVYTVTWTDKPLELPAIELTATYQARKLVSAPAMPKGLTEEANWRSHPHDILGGTHESWVA